MMMRMAMMMTMMRMMMMMMADTIGKAFIKERSSRNLGLIRFSFLRLGLLNREGLKMPLSMC
jgi:uncharacterized membrane protein